MHLTAPALLACLLDSLGVSELKSEERKKRALYAHDKLVKWLHDVYHPHIQLAVHDPKRCTSQVISLDDSDSESGSDESEENWVQAVEASFGDLSMCDTGETTMSSQDNPSPPTSSTTNTTKTSPNNDFALTDLVSTLSNIVNHFENDMEDPYKSERYHFLRILRIKAQVHNTKKVDRPMAELGLDVGHHELQFHEAIQSMPSFPSHYPPPPLPWLSDKGIFETLTPRCLYPRQQSIFDNERLEFLGDTVLETIVTDAIFDKFPKYQPWDLTKLRRKLVTNNFFSFFSDLYGLFDKLRGSRTLHPKRKADVFEAYIGALYRESGHIYTNKWLVELLEPFIFQFAEQI
ncbi:hypothetical protein E3P92_01917 [Wallemia ichthyophaga]|nr:hypothetical protein E3P92_01917 [Wallemia ichthyophaga]